MFQYFHPVDSKLFLSLFLLILGSGYGHTKFEESASCSEKCSDVFEAERTGTTICSMDPEDGDVMPLSQCQLDCHHYMKPAEDQVQCFYDFCTKPSPRPLHWQFCKEPRTGRGLRATECELVKSGEAKHYGMYCKCRSCK